ncbi:MAG: DUF5995 family protein [Nocardioidaceae bacterium]
MAAVLAEAQDRLATLPADRSSWRAFLSAYQRTTAAVADALAHAEFEDPAWVERWDVAFARLYLDAHDAALHGGAVGRPWRLAFDAAPELPDLRRVLLGINAHINYDLPQALLAVISEEDFEDPVLMARRRRDHERIDALLAGRVGAEDDELPPESWTYRLLTPLNHLSTKRFLKEARRKVWHNTFELHAARLAGPDAYRTRLAELELLSAAKIADLLEPGQVVIKLAARGFGVTLPPPAELKE